MNVVKAIRGPIAFLTLLFFLFPIVWLFMQSLVPGGYIISTTMEQFKRFTLGNYYDIFFKPYVVDVVSLLRNSIIIAGASAALATVLGSIAGYAFARFRFKRDEDVKTWILSFRFFPPIAVVVPMYLVFVQTRLYDTYQGMILLYTAFSLPFSIWLMTSFIEEVPVEIEEAAFIDGCTPFQALLKVTMPVIRGGLVTVALFNLIFAWNEFLFALVLTSHSALPMSAGLAVFSTITGINWGYLASATILMSLPIIVCSALLQRHIVRGLTFGAVKG